VVPSDQRTLEEFLAALAREHPTRTFARFNHLRDRVQEVFYEELGGNIVGFADRLTAVEGRLKQLPNYRSYLACGAEHCALTTPEFYSLRVQGVELRDWVADLAAGRDVECPACRE
jgi:hypothetical protein